MDGRHFFRQAVQELYDNPFPARSGPRISASKAAKLARNEREHKKQKTETSVAAPATLSQPAAQLTSNPTPQQQSLPGRFADHFVMNLPATAIDLLDAFDSLYTPFLQRPEEQRNAFLEHLKDHSIRKCVGEWDGELRLPMVHCYCFTKEVEEFEPDICKVS